MPFLKIQTNITLEPATEQTLLKQLSETVANEIGKSEAYVMIALEANCSMFFAGNNAPTAYLELKSLGLPEETTPSLSAALCESVTRILSIPGDRIYIEFASPPRHMWGWNGSTF